MILPRRGALILGAGAIFVMVGCGGTAPGADTAAETSDGIALEDSEADSGPLLDIGAGTTAGGGTAEAGDAGETGCAEIEVATDPVIPTVILLVDQSGSMTENFAGQDRWGAVYNTLMDPVEGVVKPLESTVRFGLTLYSSINGFEGGECPMLTQVPPALDNHAALDTVYAMSEPLNDTPTGESLAAVAADLSAFQASGPKVIVLATDGEPDTCATPNPQEGQPEALAAAQSAFAMGIETYIISVGSDISEQHLQEMANAGIGLDPLGPDQAPYYQALDVGELIGAFDEIIGGFISCTLELDGVVDLNQICEGTVWLDGQQLECNVDWELSDPSTLELIGDACEVLKNGEPHSVTATWPCDAVAIE